MGSPCGTPSATPRSTRTLRLMGFDEEEKSVDGLRGANELGEHRPDRRETRSHHQHRCIESEAEPLPGLLLAEMSAGRDQCVELGTSGDHDTLCRVIATLDQEIAGQVAEDGGAGGDGYGVHAIESRSDFIPGVLVGVETRVEDSMLHG